MAKKNCGGCGSPVSKKAKFCESCGYNLKKSPPKKSTPPARIAEPEPVDTTAGYLDEFESRESAQLSHEYFERHIEILSSYRKRLKQLAKGLDRQENHLAELADAAFTEARTRDIQKTLEAIEAVGDEWEDLQLAYNADSEVLDEEFQERFAEMEMDVELPEDLQTKMGRELDVMMRSFDRIDERIGIIGTLGNQLINQASGHWFGDGGGGSKKGILLLVSFIGAALSFLLLRFLHDAENSVALTGAAVSLIVPVLFISRF